MLGLTFRSFNYLLIISVLNYLEFYIIPIYRCRWFVDLWRIPSIFLSVFVELVICRPAEWPACIYWVGIFSWFQVAFAALSSAVHNLSRPRAQRFCARTHHVDTAVFWDGAHHQQSKWSDVYVPSQWSEENVQSVTRLYWNRWPQNKMQHLKLRNSWPYLNLFQNSSENVSLTKHFFTRDQSGHSVYYTQKKKKYLLYLGSGFVQ